MALAVGDPCREGLPVGKEMRSGTKRSGRLQETYCRCRSFLLRCYHALELDPGPQKKRGPRHGESWDCKGKEKGVARNM